MKKLILLLMTTILFAQNPGWNNGDFVVRDYSGVSKYGKYYSYDGSTYSYIGLLGIATTGTFDVSATTGTFSDSLYVDTLTANITKFTGQSTISGRIVGSPDLAELSRSPEPAYYFTTNDYVEVADNDNIDFGTGDFSIIIHGFIPQNVTATEYLLNKEAGGIGYGLYKVQDDLYIRLDDGTTDVSAIICAACFTAGNVYNIGVSFDRSGNATALIMGKTSVTSGTVDISTASLTISNAGALRVGCTTAGASFLSGSLDAVGLYNLALTSDEMALIENHGTPYKYSDTNNDELHTSSNAASDPNGNEANTTTGWGYVNGTLTSSAAQNYAGTYSLNFSCSAINNRIYYAYSSTIGYRYRYSGYIYSATTNQVKLGVGLSSVTNEFGEYILTPVSSSWTKFDIYTTSVTSGTIYFNAINNYSGANDFYLDNVSITRLGNVADFNAQGIGTNGWVGVVGDSTVMAVNSGATKFGESYGNAEGYITLLTDTTSFTLPQGYCITDIMYEVKNATNVNASFSFAASDTIVATSTLTAGDFGTLNVIKGVTQRASDTVYGNVATGDSLWVDVKMERLGR